MARKETIERAVRASKEWEAVLKWARGELGFELSWQPAEKVSWLLTKELSELQAVALQALELARLSPDGFALPFWEDFGLKDLLPPGDTFASKDDWGHWLGDMAHAVGYPIHCPEAADEAYASESKRTWLNVIYTLTSLVGAGSSFRRARLRYSLSPRRETEDDDPDLTILEVGELQDVASRLRKLGLKMKDKLEKSLTGESLELKDLTTSLSLGNPFWFSIEGTVATANREELVALVDRVIALRKRWEEHVGTHFLKHEIHRAKVGPELRRYEEDVERYRRGEVSFTGLLHEEWQKDTTQWEIRQQLQPADSTYRRSEILRQAKDRVYYRVRDRLSRGGIKAKAERGWRDKLEFHL